MATGGAAFAGSAAAQQQTTPTDEFIVDDDGGTDVNYTSIQAALNNTGDGALITVREGTYNESLNISSSNVSIQGAGIDQSVIQAAEVQLGEGESRSTAVVLGSTYTENPVPIENVSISGFTIHQNTTNGGAVQTTGNAAQANLTVEDNRFVANGTTDGYGLYLPNTQNVRVANNTFAVEGSGAVEHIATATDSEGFVVEYNTFEGDITRSGEGNAVEVRGTDFTVQNNDFSAVSTDGAIIADINNDLNLATVLNNNTFDQTVTVEDSSGTLTAGIYGAIQPAVDAASNDQTVLIGPGTYNESVSISTTNVTLEGPNAGINENRDARSDEAVIAGQLSVSAQNVTINGVQVTPNTETFNQTPAAAIIVSESDATVQNNRIGNFTVNITDIEANSTQGIQVFNAGNEITGIEIQSNSVENITYEGSSQAPSGDFGTDYGNLYGIHVQGEIGNTVVEENTIRNLTSGGYTLATAVSGTDSDVTANPEEIVIKGNIYENLNAKALPATAFEISGDRVNATNVKVSNNSINAPVGVSNGASENLNATSNWWGSQNGPAAGTNTYNDTSQGAVVSGSVEFTPWLNASTDNDGQPFAPVTNGSEGQFTSIQAAVDAADTDDNIEVESGTYNESVSIDTENVTLEGPNAGTAVTIATDVVPRQLFSKECKSFLIMSPSPALT